MNLEPINQKKLYGFNDEFDHLTYLYINNKFPNKILLSGEKGSGKSTFAYHLINFILSLDEENKYDQKNYSISENNRSFVLVNNKTCPNFYLIDIDIDKKNIDIEKIRELTNKISKSSFNNKPKFILIDNIEFLNKNSVNALLKILEEPNYNTYFILINSNRKILDTLKSRCLNYKISLSYKKSIDITNKIINNNILNFLNNDFISYYYTPGYYLNLINFANEFEVDLKEINLKELLKMIIKENYYKKNLSLSYFLNNLIELFFRKHIHLMTDKMLYYYSHFIKKIDNTKKFNLDEESLFIEFNDKILNG